jgi:sodium-dependent dicarboxylate transporter 2/3/5
VPNAVVFGTGRLSTAQMARHGLWLNVLGAAALTLVCSVLL